MDTQSRAKKDTKERKKIEKKLKILDISVETFGNEFPDISEANFNDNFNVMSGTVIGRNICNIWYEDEKKVIYNGKIEKIKKKIQDT